MATSIEHLTSQRRVFAGAAWNLLGRGLPIILAIALTPVLVFELGMERWGLFSLGLAMAGMVGVLDLGIGAALTRALADRLGQGRGEEAPHLIAAACALVLAIGLPLAGLLWAAVPWLMEDVIAVPPTMREEAILAFRILGLSAPLVVASTTLWGAVSAFQAFRVGNLLNIPLNVAYYLVPTLFLMVWDGLVPAMVAIVLSRLASVAAFGVLVSRLVPGIRRGAWPRRSDVRQLLRSGAWSSVTTVTGTLIMQGDRFVVGAMSNLTALALYATPLDLALRFGIVTAAVCTSMGPALATGLAGARERTTQLIRRGAGVLYVLLLPPALVLVAFAPELLTLWLGVDFASGSSQVLRILVCGTVIGSLGAIPGLTLDAAGRFDLNARLILVVLPLTLVASIAMTARWGIEGTAVAQLLRQVLTCGARCLIARRLDRKVFDAAQEFGLVSVLALAALWLVCLPQGLTMRLVLTSVMLVIVPILGGIILVGRREVRAAVFATTRHVLGRRIASAP